MLQGDSTLDPYAKVTAVTAVTVNGKAGQLALADGGDDAERLIYPDAKGNKILIQVPVSLGLSNAQIVRFAEGVSVTSAARAGSADLSALPGGRTDAGICAAPRRPGQGWWGHQPEASAARAASRPDAMGAEEVQTAEAFQEACDIRPPASPGRPSQCLRWQRA